MTSVMMKLPEFHFFLDAFSERSQHEKEMVSARDLVPMAFVAPGDNPLLFQMDDRRADGADAAFLPSRDRDAPLLIGREEDHSFERI